VLDISDDALGKQALRLGDSGRKDKSIGEIYVAQLAGGRFAVCMFTRGGAVPMTFEESDLRALSVGEAAAGGSWKVRDLWTHTANGTLAANGKISKAVPASDTVLFTLTPV